MDREQLHAAIDRLAESLCEYAYQGKFGIKVSTIRLLLTPVDPEIRDARHVHIVDLTPQIAELLAEAIEQLVIRTSVTDAGNPADSSPAADFARSNPELAADITDAFNEIDLIDLTREVLDDTAPRDRLAVTRALDALLGDMPTEDQEDEDDDE